MTDSQHTQETQTTRDAHAPQEPAQVGTAQRETVDPEDVAPSLAALIMSIRAAVARGASSEMRMAGATACRSILAVLEAKPGQPLAAPPHPATAPTSPIAALLSQPGLLAKLAAMSREQLLDLLKQATAAVPPRAPTPATAGPRFHLIEIPQARRSGGS